MKIQSDLIPLSRPALSRTDSGGNNVEGNMKKSASLPKLLNSNQMKSVLTVFSMDYSRIPKNVDIHEICQKTKTQGDRSR